MNWSTRDQHASHAGWPIIVGVLAAASVISLSSTAGLCAANTGVAALVQPVLPESAAPNQITGVLQSINGSSLAIVNRKGASVSINDVGAVQAHRAMPLVIGKAFIFGGTYDPHGKFLATIILRARNSSYTWPADR